MRSWVVLFLLHVSECYIITVFRSISYDKFQTNPPLNCVNFNAYSSNQFCVCLSSFLSDANSRNHLPTCGWYPVIFVTKSIFSKLVRTESSCQGTRSVYIWNIYADKQTKTVKGKWQKLPEHLSANFTFSRIPNPESESSPSTNFSVTTLAMSLWEGQVVRVDLLGCSSRFTIKFAGTRRYPFDISIFEKRSNLQPTTTSSSLTIRTTEISLYTTNAVTDRSLAITLATITRRISRQTASLTRKLISGTSATVDPKPTNSNPTTLRLSTERSIRIEKEDDVIMLEVAIVPLCAVILFVFLVVVAVHCRVKILKRKKQREAMRAFINRRNRSQNIYIRSSEDPRDPMYASITTDEGGYAELYPDILDEGDSHYQGLEKEELSSSDTAVNTVPQTSVEGDYVDLDKSIHSVSSGDHDYFELHREESLT